MSLWPAVLMYHRVVPDQCPPDPTGNSIHAKDFDRQLTTLLRAGFNCVSLSTIATALAEPERLLLLPERPFSITFDDGYRDNHQYAWPILRRHGLTATIFLVTDWIGDFNGFDRELELDPVPMLTAAQIREMHLAGIDFGSHTCSHPANLSLLAEPALQHELVDSRSAVETVLGARCFDFSYPHGRLDSRVEAAVGRAGYELACGAVGSRLARYCLSRVDAARWTGRALLIGLVERELRRLVQRRAPEVEMGDGSQLAS